MGPHGGMHRLNARAQVIAHTILAQTLNIFGVTIKRDYAARGSDKARGTECEGSQVRTDVVDDIAGVDDRGDDTLDFGLVLAAPEAGFLRYTQAHPQSQRETGLHLDPGRAARQSATLDEILSLVEPGLPLRPTAKHRVDNTLLEREVGAIHNEVQGVQGSWTRSKECVVHHSECTAAIGWKAKGRRTHGNCASSLQDEIVTRRTG